VALAVFHGVAPLLWVRSREANLPAAVREQLRVLYATCTMRNEALAAETERILAVLRKASIPAMAVKGPLLSQRLYGDAGARPSADMDVLIRPEDLERADGVLHRIGYAREIQLDIEDFRGAQELVYRKASSGGLAFPLDLHQRLLPYVEADPLTERVWTEGMTDENLLLYLCTNQVGHRFSALKYVCDVQGFLAQSSDTLDWEKVVRGAREIEFTPGIYYSLAAVQELAGASVPEGVLRALRPGHANRRFARWVLGKDAYATLELAGLLASSYGAFATIVCARKGARLRQVRRLLFPSAAYLRQTALARPEQSTWSLYLDRWRRKIPEALRHLLRAVP
jgi:hypothetical protein